MKIAQAKKLIKAGTHTVDDFKMSRCRMCNGHGMDEYPADRISDYRYMPCISCGGMGVTCEETKP